MSSDVAKKVIRKFGGAKAVSKVLGLSTTQVYRFQYPKSKGGTGGLIPAEHAHTLLREARTKGIELEPSDFFDTAA